MGNDEFSVNCKKAIAKEKRSTQIRSLYGTLSNSLPNTVSYTVPLRVPPRVPNTVPNTVPKIVVVIAFNEISLSVKRQRKEKKRVEFWDHFFVGIIFKFYRNFFFPFDKAAIPNGVIQERLPEEATLTPYTKRRRVANITGSLPQNNPIFIYSFQIFSLSNLQRRGGVFIGI